MAVNQTRRLFPANRQIRELLAAGAIGRPSRIVYEMGEPFEWPAVSDSYFGTKGSGKGVLLDTGAHIVDLVTWWLGGKPQLTRFRDDSFGGTEAVAAIELEHGGCRASIRLSWLSKLRNFYRIEGERGSIEGEVYDWSSFIQRSARRRAHSNGHRGRRRIWRRHSRWGTNSLVVPTQARSTHILYPFVQQPGNAVDSGRKRFGKWR